MRYSSQIEINRHNVKNLSVAWMLHSLPGGFDGPTVYAMECTPIATDGVLYLTSADMQLLAVDGAKGKVLWRFRVPEKPRVPRLPDMEHACIHFLSSAQSPGVPRPISC